MGWHGKAQKGTQKIKESAQQIAQNPELQRIQVTIEARKAVLIAELLDKYEEQLLLEAEAAGGAPNGGMADELETAQKLTPVRSN